MNRIRIAATTAAVLSLGVITPAAAQGPATIRGQVYDCSSRAPVAGANVELFNAEDGTRIELRGDAQGRFVRVGLAPGTYRIGATNPTGSYQRTAFRLARLETDDVLDVPIGTWSHLVSPHDGCEAFRVPLAVSTSTRYIIH